MAALFLNDNRTNDDGNTKEKGNNNMFILTKTTTLHVHHAILYISFLSLYPYDMELPNLTSPLYGVGEHNRKIVAFFFLT